MPLVLPGDPAFEATLSGALPPVNEGMQPLYIQRPGSLLLEPVTPEEMTEFYLSGEYDERLEEMGEYDEGDDWEEWIMEDFLI